MIEFKRDEWARSYAKRHLTTDPGILTIQYLPTSAPDREIRFVEINELMPTRDDDPLEPIDFGVDTGTESAHSLMVLDVTPDQWDKIVSDPTRLPDGWSLEGRIPFQRTAQYVAEPA